MSGENDVHSSLDESSAQLVGIIDHVRGGQRVLHVEVGNQMVVHHGNDAFAGTGGLLSLFDEPLLA